MVLINTMRIEGLHLINDGTQVVLFGTSYYGLTQPQVARLRPPAMKGFFTNEMRTDFFRHIAD
ncbi:hypothetical protein [Xanthobacter autotrophicus]|uniref:hypothetical protein n=1 Tax=Xanthobacter autotrophicus TaxID=280 RepID=UPI00372D8044